MMSSHHVPYELGYTRATMAITMRSDPVMVSKSIKIVSVQIAVCNSTA